ncbi:serine/threonine protein kinase [Xanthomonas sacchari]|uniref:serine/threonine-protein kinase n=1 Tax=Xanthomonas sacchari TaxID=56458 RepID=UPI0022502ACE|nr:serine/threonine-protein kinase [Xanthomonas sacchari]MCW0411069.1 Serine/threonine-protein kinase PknD [Xanthomonas sacchari]UYK67674.1 serine/threonine protein kinase [Xanthomonas sacchari]
MANVVPALQVGAKLGAGHFGVVYLGTDIVHGEVAVKVLERKNGQDDASWDAHKASFLSEAQNLSKAKHRNVVEVFYIEELPDGKSIRFCMAYCSGGSLQSAYENGPMDLKLVRKIATEVSMGLGALHARNMLHRDIKPRNILIDGQGVAKLGDFGLVTDRLIMGYGSVAGYSDHIAFEVWGGNPTSPKTDIWALGMTLYRLLHGQDWYERSPAPRHIVKNGGFANSLTWLPHIPKAWRTVIRRMLNDVPSARYQNAQQLLNAFSNLPTPAWTTTVSADKVIWQQLGKTRKKIVEWTMHSARSHSWSARSEPANGAGKVRSLGGSKGHISLKPALRELSKFFNG